MKGVFSKIHPKYQLNKGNKIQASAVKCPINFVSDR